MVMRLAAAFVMTSLSILAKNAQAHQYNPNNSVGLGLGAGVQLPSAENPYRASEAWGFFTDIPLLETFHVSPSTMVYRLNPKDGSPGKSATDISMNFKFIVPIKRVDFMAGVTAGITSTDELKPHVGIIGGTSFNLVSNL